MTKKFDNLRLLYTVSVSNHSSNTYQSHDIAIKSLLNGKPRNIMYPDMASDTGLYLEDVALHGWMFDTPEFEVHWTPEWTASCERGDLGKFERATKTLRLFDRRLRKLRCDRGRSRTFGEFIGRACEVSGIPAILTVSGKYTGSYDDMSYREFLPGQADEMVEYMVQRARRFVGKGGTV